MMTILERNGASRFNRFPNAERGERPQWSKWMALAIGAILLSFGAAATSAQTPTPTPSPSPSASPSPQPGCTATATASVTIAGGGGAFSPFSLTIDAATQVTWTNTGNSRARVRDVDHVLLDSDDLQPGQSYSFTFCASGTYQIEDARSGVRSTITVVGGPNASPTPSPFPTPGTSPSPSASPTPGVSPSPSASPTPGVSPSPSPQPTCDPTAISSVAITGGGGPFNPSLLTVNAGTRVTWTNIGNSRARVRDVDHTFLDSDDLEPGQSFSFTFCVAGTFRIEDARSNARATISVLGNTDPSPSPSPSPSPGVSPSPSPSPGVSPSPSPSPSPATQPVNISTRLRVAPGEGLMIGGFIITGDDAKRVIIRGIGPSLTAEGVPGVVNDPILRLFGPSGFEFAMNDNWRDTQQPEVEASSIPPRDERESAIVATLVPSVYTASLADVNGASGVGLVEVYDLNSGAPAKLANISTRGSVQRDDNVMIGGFSLGGSNTNPVRVVVRAIGPSLTAAGVDNALSDPTLRLFNNDGQSVAFNDNWADDADQAAQLQSLGIAPSNAAESAIVTTLPAGLYTAVVAGQGGAVGIGLIEIYAVQ